ncbi:DNA-binding protein [Saliphagus sp. GCM10025308]
MSTKKSVSKVVSVDEQAYEQEAVQEGADVVDETPEFRPTIEMEIQAKVDSNHPEGIVDTSDDRIYGVTLAQEERIRAREEELERISVQAAFGRQEGRAERTRAVVEAARRERVVKEVDPREKLERGELGQINQQAQRLAEDVQGGYTRAVIGKRIASRVLEGKDMFEAVMDTKEEIQHEAGTIVPIGDLESIRRGEVSVEGRVLELWDASSPAIQQVGLLEDETGRTKFTIWTKSTQTMVREGERVRFRAAAKNWYNGRCSIALTHWSEIRFPERESWWE